MLGTFSRIPRGYIKHLLSEKLSWQQQIWTSTAREKLCVLLLLLLCCCCCCCCHSERVKRIRLQRVRVNWQGVSLCHPTTRQGDRKYLRTLPSWPLDYELGAEYKGTRLYLEQHPDYHPGATGGMLDSHTGYIPPHRIHIPPQRIHTPPHRIHIPTHTHMTKYIYYCSICEDTTAVQMDTWQTHVYCQLRDRPTTRTHLTRVIHFCVMPMTPL